MRLPPGLREQPGWIFIGTLCALAGLGYLLGLSESASITRVMNPIWLHVWGGFLALSGSLLVLSTWTRNKPLERMSLRFLSLGLMVYGSWVLTVLPLAKATMTISLCVALTGLAEIRVGVLKALLRTPAHPYRWDGDDV